MSPSAEKQPAELVGKNGISCSSFSNSSRIYCRGFTYLELIFVILIISTLVSMMLVRILPAIDRAERASVLQLEGQVRSSLAVIAAKHVAAGEQGQVRAMQGMNPMDIMLDLPRNYVGVRHGFGEVPEGSWFFRSDLEELRYRPREQSSTQYKDIPLGEVAFRVDVVEAAVGERKEIYGVRLTRASGENWLVATP